MENTGGIILCGGQSKRMGQPKAWLPFGDELLLQRVVRIVGTVVNPIVVVAAPDQEVPPLPESIIIARDEEKGRGPLQGLAAGWRALPQGVDAAYLSSCDAPFVKPAFISRLIELLGDDAICVPRVGDFHHPLAAVYRRRVLPVIDQLLLEDRLRPVFLFERLPTRIVEAAELHDADPSFQSLRNLNTLEDYQAALCDFNAGEAAHEQR